MTEGKSERQAAKEAGLSRTNLQRYLKDGMLPDGLPIWPDQVGQISENVPADAAQGWTTEAQGGPLNGPPENSLAEGQHVGGLAPVQRDASGRFLPGNTAAAGAQHLKAAREAKEKLANYAPFVADTLIKIFGALPVDRPELILAYAKEILDRGLGKPIQSVKVNEERLGIEYQFFQAVISNGDERTIREAQALAVRMESYARNNGGASVRGPVEIIPPPGGTLNFANARRDGQVSETDNLDASAAWEE